MSKIFIINGHQPYPFAKGELNAAMVERIESQLSRAGYETRVTEVAKGYDAEAEVANHLWADVIITQHPVNWMGVPWVLKKYMDEVYTAGMDGRLTAGDGRTSASPKSDYGMGGQLEGKKYMLSLTLNAPKEAFDDPTMPFFKGLSLDQLMMPTHLNAKFFGMAQLPTFAAFDVMKNPEIEADFARLEAHLSTHLPVIAEA